MLQSSNVRRNVRSMEKKKRFIGLGEATSFFLEGFFLCRVHYFHDPEKWWHTGIERIMDAMARDK